MEIPFIPFTRIGRGESVVVSTLAGREVARGVVKFSLSHGLHVVTTEGQRVFDASNYRFAVVDEVMERPLGTRRLVPPSLPAVNEQPAKDGPELAPPSADLAPDEVKDRAIRVGSMSADQAGQVIREVSDALTDSLRRVGVHEPDVLPAAVSVGEALEKLLTGGG